MEIDENDIYKLEGQILFKVEKLSEFARAPIGTQRRSNVVCVCGLPWHIMSVNHEYKQIKNLDCFLFCNADNSGLLILNESLVILLLSQFLRFWLVLYSQSNTEGFVPKGRQARLCAPI